MDLSKAFDCLPHDILLDKLNLYGLNANALSMMEKYLSSRKQQVKIGDITSTLSSIKKGVPQGSILGLLLFNVLWMTFSFLSRNLSYITMLTIIPFLIFLNVLINLSVFLRKRVKYWFLEWFGFNCMQANPDKWQAIVVGEKTFKISPSFNIRNSTITCDETVRLLDIDIDFKLN